MMYDDELTPEEKFAAEDSETMVPRALAQGQNPEEIVAQLIRLDWSPAAARALVARVADDLRRYQDSPESRNDLAKEGRTQFIAGLALALLGAGITAFTILTALGGFTSYFVVAIGAIFGGLILAARGWTRWRLYRQNQLPFVNEGRGQE